MSEGNLAKPLQKNLRGLGVPCIKFDPGFQTSNTNNFLTVWKIKKLFWHSLVKYVYNKSGKFQCYSSCHSRVRAFEKFENQQKNCFEKINVKVSCSDEVRKYQQYFDFRTITLLLLMFSPFSPTTIIFSIFFIHFDITIHQNMLFSCLFRQLPAKVLVSRHIGWLVTTHGKSRSRSRDRREPMGSSENDAMFEWINNLPNMEVSVEKQPSVFQELLCAYF